MHIREAVIVEGKYDKIKLSAFLDAVIIETNGFGIFKDKKKMGLIRQLAEKDGILVLTDSDGAGFQIRAKLSSCIPPSQIKHAYIPDIFGKERRKRSPSKEGKLGVEGVELEILRKALARAGIQPAENEKNREALTQADFYRLGLSGKINSREKRLALIQHLQLPERISAKAFFQVIARLYDRAELAVLLNTCAENFIDAEEVQNGEHSTTGF